jgi:MSHA biogenesis protein MshE
LRKKIRIGELLVQNRIISQEQLDTALKEQKRRGKRLGQLLVQLKYVEEDALHTFLAEQLRIPFIDLTQRDVDRETVLKLPETHARRFRAIILEDTGQDFLVGMADPMDIVATDELSRMLKRPIRQALVRERDVLHTIDSLYRRTAEISSFAVELGEELSPETLGDLGIADEATEAPVAKLLNSLFEDAIGIKASDIHIEPDESVLRVRQRVDGVLQEHVMNEKRIASAMVLRLKLMSGLDISEKRLPQDGRFNIQVKGRSIDVRVATMPVRHGEAVVMRLLDQSGEMLSLDQIGMPDGMLARFRHLIRRPHGLILVTGPTGSGKTTTLYGALKELNEPEKKIVTVEDPVEYRLERINQVQVNTKIDLTFARVLRSTLRHDPDIVMVGEMRDQETAEIALRASMTGHLVLSTLHTNSALDTPFRLVDMGIEGYLAASALRAVIAQRLVRRVCHSCPEEHQPDARERVWLTAKLGPKAAELRFRRGRGCSHCHSTGYQGRIGVYEFLELDGPMAEALRRDDHESYQRLARANKSFRPLTFAALEYAAKGQTTLEEVFRISEALEDTFETSEVNSNDDPAEASTAPRL